MHVINDFTLADGTAVIARQQSDGKDCGRENGQYNRYTLSSVTEQTLPKINRLSVREHFPV